MNMQQTVEIPLEEYLELRDLRENEKFVKLDMKVHVNYGGVEMRERSSGLSWKSNGEVWSTLASYLDNANRRLDIIHANGEKFISDLHRMSMRDFRALKKTIASLPSFKDALNTLIPGWEATIPAIEENPYEADDDGDSDDNEDLKKDPEEATE